MIGGYGVSPLEVRKNARMTRNSPESSCVAKRVTELRQNGNRDERHYDVVLNKYMHAHTHTHAAFHMGVVYNFHGPET